MLNLKDKEIKFVYTHQNAILQVRCNADLKNLFTCYLVSLKKKKLAI